MLRSLPWLLLSCLLLAAPARAGSLASGSVVGHLNRHVSCSVWNAGAKPIRDVLVELVFLASPPGDVVGSAGPLDIVPGETLVALAVLDLPQEEGEYACRAAHKGSGKALRGALRLKLADVTETLLPMQ